MITPLQHWHDSSGRIHLEDAFTLVELMPEWDWMRDDRRVPVLLERLPARYRDDKFRLSKTPMVSKREFARAVRSYYIKCQTCRRTQMCWPARHTARRNQKLAELRRFNSEIFDALAGKMLVAVCTWCSSAYKDDPEMFLVRLLERRARAA